MLVMYVIKMSLKNNRFITGMKEIESFYHRSEEPCEEFFRWRFFTPITIGSQFIHVLL